MHMLSAAVGWQHAGAGLTEWAPLGAFRIFTALITNGSTIAACAAEMLKGTGGNTIEPQR